MFPQNPGVLFLYNCMWFCRNLKIKSLRNRYFLDSLHWYHCTALLSLWRCAQEWQSSWQRLAAPADTLPERRSCWTCHPTMFPAIPSPACSSCTTWLGLGIGWRSVPWPMSIAKHTGRKMRRLPGWAWPVHRSHLGWVFSGWLRKGKPEGSRRPALNTEARRGKGVAATACWRPAGKWGRPSCHHKEWTPAAAGMGLAETSFRRRPPHPTCNAAQRTSCTSPAGPGAHYCVLL